MLNPTENICWVLIAAYLDPRTHTLPGLSAYDKGCIEAETKRHMMSLQPTEFDVGAVQADAGPAQHRVPMQGAAAQHHAQYADLLAGLDGIGGPLPAVVGVAAAGQQQTQALVNAEVTLWNNEATLPRVVMAADGGQVISNPLLWWYTNKSRFPRLYALARRYLCVQATSAAAERLFSAAGLTIANDRAGLLPDNAAMLVFLHEVLPEVRAWRARHNMPDI